MGKSKPRVRAKDRADPFSKPTKPPADPELAAIREQRILPVLQDLQSSDLNKRSAAARAIVNLIEATKTRKLLLREKIVKILFDQTLTDSNLETRTDGWGILQNLALEEEADFSVHLYRLDILTAISGVIKTIMQTLGSKELPVSNLPKAQQQLLWRLSMSVVSLLTSLCETQEEIVEAISKMPTLLGFLDGILTFQLSPAELRHEALSCMMALTEDNKAVAQQVVDNSDELGYLMKLKDANDDESVVACGILHNIFAAMKWFDHNTPVEGISDAVLIPVLSKTLDRVSTSNGSNGTNGHAQHSSPEQVLQLALDIVASIATGLQEAIEHGSRNEKEFEGFGDDAAATDVDAMDAEDADQDQQEGEDEEDDEMTQEEIDADMALVLGDGPSDDDERPSEEVTLENLIRIATPQIISLSKRALSASDDNSVKTHALAALNNIAWTVSSIDFSTGHIEKIRRSWIASAQTIWNDIVCAVLALNTADVDLASSITSLAWAVSRSVKGALQISNDEHRKFMALYQASKGMSLSEPTKDAKPEADVDAFQGLGVKCIGVLGSLALNPAPVELNREIGVFLITVLQSLPDLPLADGVEALNQIFDIYADEDYPFDEPVFWGNNFYKHLEEIQPKARKMAKSINMRLAAELRARADEAVLNLGRFLVYKKKERKNKRAN